VGHAFLLRTVGWHWGMLRPFDINHGWCTSRTVAGAKAYTGSSQSSYLQVIVLIMKFCLEGESRCWYNNFVYSTWGFPTSVQGACINGTGSCFYLGVANKTFKHLLSIPFVDLFKFSNSLVELFRFDTVFFYCSSVRKI
jgi:hypothetical protein